MSAYLCTPEHIAALAVFAATQRNSLVLFEWRHATPIMSALSCAEKLAAANLASIRARYPERYAQGWMPGPIFEGCEGDPAAYALEYVNQCRRAVEHYFRDPPKLKPLDYYSMAMCLEYQSCEVSDWLGCPAWRQIANIADGAVRLLPGFADSVREWVDPGATEAGNVRRLQ